MEFEGETLHMHTPASEIDALNTRLASEVEEHYQDTVSTENPLHMVITLKGAAQFGVDLSRKIHLPVRLDFIRASSYGKGTKTSGNVQILKDVESDLANKHVLLLDEIVDSGFTIDFVLSMFRMKNPKSLKVCALLSKPSRREVEVPLDFVGKETPDQFLVGYGLDYGERYRNLPDIYYIKT